MYGTDERPEQGCYPGNDGWKYRIKTDGCVMMNIVGVMLTCMNAGGCYFMLGDELQKVRDAAAASTATHTEEEEGLVPATRAAEGQALVVRTKEEQELAAGA